MNSEQLKQEYAALLSGGHISPEVTDRYHVVPTIDIVDYLEQTNEWELVHIETPNVRKENPFTTKHMLRFDHCYYRNKNRALSLYVINSHNGKAAVKIMAGFFEFVCANGCAVGDYYAERLTHKRIRAAMQTIDMLADVTRKAIELHKVGETWQVIDLQEHGLDRVSFMQRAAKEVLPLRNQSIEAIPSDSNFYVPRKEQSEPSVWNCYQTLQEKLIRGGYDYINEAGKRREAREIKNISAKVKLNEALFNAVAKQVTALPKTFYIN
ncbi:DUF932 domain-containing protein [Candidatus Parcubacteria bacterium]|nr:MAG: DUF932 domain-containing protein [Candidatus Parcubacteria bacterium]